MSDDLTRRRQYSTQELDELQRGQETAPTLENLEGVAMPHHGERREIPVPHPGERPNAVRADRAGRQSSTGTAELDRPPTEEGGRHDNEDLAEETA